MKILEEIISLVSDKISVFKSVGSIIKLETRLAGLSIVPFLLSIIVLLISVMGLWLVAAVLMGYGIFQLSDSILIAIVSVLVLNIAACLGLVKYLVFNIKNMSFEKTREYLFHRENGDHEIQQEAIAKNDPQRGEDIAVSSSKGQPT